MRRFAAPVLAAGLSPGLVATAIAATPIAVPALDKWVSSGVEVTKGQVRSISGIGHAHTAAILDFLVPGVARSASGPEGQTWGSTCGDAYATFPAALRAHTGPSAVADAHFGELVGRVGRNLVE